MRQKKNLGPKTPQARRAKASRLSESEEERRKRLAEVRQRQAITRMNESEESRAIRLEKMRIKAQEQRKRIAQERNSKIFKEAVNAVLNKTMGYEEASEQFNVQKERIIRYIKKFKTPNQTEPSTQQNSSKEKRKSKTTTGSGPAFETLSSADSLFEHFFFTQPTDEELRIKQENQFGDKFFEEKQQIAPTLSTPMTAPPAPRQQQVLAPPAMAKPKPVKKPQPQKKRLLVVANHQQCVMSNLASLWKSGKLCDAGIGNGSSTVRVHKVVLSAVCPKLLSAFSADFFSQKFMQVNFPEKVSTDALNAFAEYMYKGVLNLDCDILEQLKIIANKLDMKEFEQLCDKHLPNHEHQPASTPAATTATFTNVPLVQTTTPIPAMTSSFAPPGSAISTSTQRESSVNTPFINIKQEISEDELVQVVYGQESEVVSLAPNKSGNATDSDISPSVKTEVVGPEDDKYGHWSGGSSSNQAFTSTTSSSTITATASTSVQESSTEFAIPFSEITDVKSTRLKATHSYESPLVSDLSPASGIVETVCSQSNDMNVDSSKPLSRPFVSTSSFDGPSASKEGGVYPVGLFTAGGDNLPLLTTPTVDVKPHDLYETDLTSCL